MGLALAESLPSLAAPVPTDLAAGRIKHSVCKWCYGKVPLDEFCKSVRQIGIESVEPLGPKDRLLYDIYHMQIMEGDIIRNIRENIQYIGHFHTGGVPGRNEIDDSQELCYPAIMRAIADTGYTGYVGQEFIPRKDDWYDSLRQSIEICTV